MSAYDLILVVLVAVGAFAVGYQLGHFKALNERGPQGRAAEDDRPLPGPLDGPLAAPAPSRPRGPPPPSSAGDSSAGEAGRPTWTGADAGSSGSGSTGAGSTGSAPPRRSTKPPPAAAGLMDKSSGKSDKEPK